MTNLTSIKLRLARLSVDELKQVQDYCESRSSKLHVRERELIEKETIEKETWEKHMAHLKPGDVLYVNVKPSIDDRTMPEGRVFGRRLVVAAIQPRAKRIWLDSESDIRDRYDARRFKALGLSPEPSPEALAARALRALEATS